MADLDDKKASWLRLSPLLDELLELDATARAARLDALRAQDPALAAELAPLLQRQEALEKSDFLAKPPPLLTDTPTVCAGQQIGAYTLAHELGRGGMGTVWLARRTDGRFEGQVAVKFLTSGLLGRGDAGRFAREGQILARLAHPHIARLIDAGLTPQTQQPYLVLEYVDGEPINRYCEQQQLDMQARVKLFLDVLAAVAHAHNRLILHRDLKPSNILVDKAGEVKLLDFGIAKLLGDPEQGAGASTGDDGELTRQAGRAFTPQYAAPEQVQGGDVTTATDVYALGVLLYVLLSGAHPTAGRTKNAEQQASALEQMRELVEVEPRRLSEQAARSEQAAVSASARELRGDLDTIVAKALKKAPTERYANAEALAQDLRRWLAHEPIAARPDSAGYRIAKFVRRHRLGVAAGSAAVLAIAAGAGIALWKADEAHEQRVQAEGLIEFMLGDLRKKLDPVGRLDVLDAVGDKALAYYARQDLARSDADSLGRRARALHLMGEIAEKRGKMGEAEKLFVQASESTAELLARDPKNTQRLFDHAQSSYWVGYAAWRQRRLPQAEAGFSRYLELANELVRIEPGKPEWLTEQASARSNLGVLKLRSGAVTAALAHFQAAEKIWQRVLPERPALRSELATSLGWLAEAQERLGLFDASITSQQAKLAALLPPGGQIGNDRKLQQGQATVDATLARLHLAAGRGAEALAAAQKASDTYVTLASLDPGNLDKLERLCIARQQLAEIHMVLGSREAARVILTQVGADLEKLRNAHERKPDLQARIRGRWLLASLAAAGTTEQRQTNRTALVEFLTNKTIEAAKSVQDTDTQWVLALAYLVLGDALPPGKESEAAAHWQAALARLVVLGEVSEPRVICLRAHALLRLGRTQEARALAENLEASAYRHPLYAELVRRLAAQPAPH